MSQPHCLAGLRSARRKARIEAQEVADRLGVTVNTYHRYEAGSRRMYFDQACVTADMLEVSLDELRVAPAAEASDTVVAAEQLEGWGPVG